VKKQFPLPTVLWPKSKRHGERLLAKEGGEGGSYQRGKRKEAPGLPPQLTLFNIGKRRKGETIAEPSSINPSPKASPLVERPQTLTPKRPIRIKNKTAAQIRNKQLLGTSLGNSWQTLRKTKKSPQLNYREDEKLLFITILRPVLKRTGRPVGSELEGEKKECNILATRSEKANWHCSWQ